MTKSVFIVGPSPTDKALEPVLEDVREAAAGIARIRRYKPQSFGAPLAMLASGLERRGSEALVRIADAIRSGIEAAQEELESARAAEAGTPQENHPTTDEGGEEAQAAYNRIMSKAFATAHDFTQEEIEAVKGYARFFDSSYAETAERLEIYSNYKRYSEDERYYARRRAAIARYLADKEKEG